MPVSSSRKQQAREKAAKLRAEQERAEKRSQLMFRVGIGALVVVLVGVVVFVALNRDSESPSETIAGLESNSDVTRNHVEGAVDYPNNPPLGGDHAPTWLGRVVGQCGAFAEPVPTENAVHSLEHGAIWITYDPELESDQVSTLEEYAEGESKIIVSPFEGMDTPIAVSGWGNQVKVDDASDERIEQFIDAFEGQGPEPGAQC